MLDNHHYQQDQINAGLCLQYKTGNHATSIKIPSSGYINYVPNRIFGQTGSRFGIYVQRNASDQGVHRQGYLIHRSSRSRLASVDSLHRQRDSINLLLSSNTRENTADTFANAHDGCLCWQKQPKGFDSMIKFS